MVTVTISGYSNYRDPKYSGSVMSVKMKGTDANCVLGYTGPTIYALNLSERRDQHIFKIYRWKKNL
jgi:hypothetical protein